MTGGQRAMTGGQRAMTGGQRVKEGESRCSDKVSDAIGAPVSPEPSGVSNNFMPFSELWRHEFLLNLFLVKIYQA